jgi:hypothetical protein
MCFAAVTRRAIRNLALPEPPNQKARQSPCGEETQEATMTYLFTKLALNAPIFARIFNPYRPELHYMRGPGPACRAKQAALIA